MKNNKPPLKANRRNIILIFALTCLTGTILASVSLSFILQKITMHHWMTDLKSVAAAYAPQCDNEITEAQKSLAFLAQMPAFSTLPDVGQIDPAIHGIPEDADTKKRDLLRRFMGTGERFSVLYVLKPKNDFYLVQPLKSGWGLMLARKIESVLSEIRSIVWGVSAVAGCLFFIISFIGVLIARRIGGQLSKTELALRKMKNAFAARLNRLPWGSPLCGLTEAG